MMTIGIGLRSDYSTNPGGDLVQALNTASELRKLGIRVRLLRGMSDRNAVRQCDIVHLFNLTRLADTYSFANAARQSRTPYVLSPIWHSLDHMQRFYSRQYRLGRLFSIRTYLALKEIVYNKQRLTSEVFATAAYWKNCQALVLNGAARVLPNSPEELSTLTAELNIPAPPATIIPNGINLSQCSKISRSKTPTVVCSGRIEPRKNTLAVLQAFLSSTLASTHQIVLVGAINDLHTRYAKDVRRFLNDQRVRWLGHLPHDEAHAVYASADILILASFFETTGLVGLEALCHQTKIIMTERSYNDYYYSDKAIYCNPDNVNSIRQALETAANAPPPIVPASFFAQFSWQAVAEATLRVYLEIQATERRIRQGSA